MWPDEDRHVLPALLPVTAFNHVSLSPFVKSIGFIQRARHPCQPISNNYPSLSASSQPAGQSAGQQQHHSPVVPQATPPPWSPWCSCHPSHSTARSPSLSLSLYPSLLSPCTTFPSNAASEWGLLCSIHAVAAASSSVTLCALQTEVSLHSPTAACLAVMLCHQRRSSSFFFLLRRPERDVNLHSLESTEKKVLHPLYAANIWSWSKAVWKLRMHPRNPSDFLFVVLW